MTAQPVRRPEASAPTEEHYYTFFPAQRPGAATGLVPPTPRPIGRTRRLAAGHQRRSGSRLAAG